LRFSPDPVGVPSQRRRSGKNAPFPPHPQQGPTFPKCALVVVQAVFFLLPRTLFLKDRGVHFSFVPARALSSLFAGACAAPPPSQQEFFLSPAASVLPRPRVFPGASNALPRSLFFRDKTNLLGDYMARFYGTIFFRILSFFFERDSFLKERDTPRAKVLSPPWENLPP